MILIGVATDELDGPWVASVESLDVVAGSSASLIAPVQRFWSDPQEWMSRPAVRVVKVGVGGISVVPPVVPQARVVCIGLNYEDHIAEGSFKDVARSPYPTLFGRWTRSLSVGGQPVRVPTSEPGLDWEGEVAAWIGSTLREASPEEARASVLGYSTFNDITARIAQKRTSQFMLGKNVDASGPLGPMVTADEVGDMRDGWSLTTKVNGVVVQESSTDHQIHELGDVLSYISQTVTIHPGDIVCTGTPSGVGYARDPQWLLGDGDVVSVTVAGLGTLQTPVTAHDGRATRSD